MMINDNKSFYDLIPYDDFINNFNIKNFEIIYVEKYKKARSKCIINTNSNYAYNIHKPATSINLIENDIMIEKKILLKEFSIDGFYHICNLKEKNRINLLK